MDRDKKIIRTSLIGIVANLILVAFKAVIGFATNSIAIILDAVNNLSDALSSGITIIGTRLASKAPDKKHPFGHGRVEYLTSVVISIIVLIAGITSIKESIEKIVSPVKAQYTSISVFIIAVAVVVKFFMGTYVKRVGKKVNSGSLIASGQDAFFDSVLSFATLIAALLSMAFGISVEGWLGTIISVIIIKAGIEMLMETLNSLIGSRTERELTVELKKRINSHPGVYGAYDVMIHNYGPTQFMGSVHIEVDDSLNARQIHELTHDITADVFNNMGIVLTVGIYAANTSDPLCVQMTEYIRKTIKEYPEILSMHGFFKKDSSVMFDMVIDFKADTPRLIQEIKNKFEQTYPGYTCNINVDLNYSD